MPAPMPATFTNLLNQTVHDNESDNESDANTASASETLADTLRKHAKQLTDEDLTVLVAGLREQRARWTVAQAQGDKKLVTSKKIATKRKTTKKAQAIVPLGSGFAIKPKVMPTAIKKPIL